jgi:hypothetical protein
VGRICLQRWLNKPGEDVRFFYWNDFDKVVNLDLCIIRSTGQSPQWAVVPMEEEEEEKEEEEEEEEKEEEEEDEEEEEEEEVLSDWKILNYCPSSRKRAKFLSF